MGTRLTKVTTDLGFTAAQEQPPCLTNAAARQIIPKPKNIIYAQRHVTCRVCMCQLVAADVVDPARHASDSTRASHHLFPIPHPMLSISDSTATQPKTFISRGYTRPDKRETDSDRVEVGVRPRLCLPNCHCPRGEGDETVTEYLALHWPLSPAASSDGLLLPFRGWRNQDYCRPEIYT